MQRLFYGVLVALCWALSAGAVDAKPPKDELLYYEARFPAINPIREARVAVQVDGKVAAMVSWGSRSAEETLRLSTGELRELKALIRKVGRFGQIERDAPPGLHAPTGTLQVTLDGQGKELFRSDRKKVWELHGFAWKCLHQVEVMADMRKGDASSLLNAVSRPPRPQQVLQPYTFRKPLEELIRSSKRWNQELGSALVALAWLNTPEEWIRFLSDLKSTKNELFRGMAKNWLPWGPEEHVSAYLVMLDRIGSEDPDVSFGEIVRRWVKFIREFREQR